MDWIIAILLFLILLVLDAIRKAIVVSFSRREALVLQLMRQVRDPNTGYDLPPV